MNLVFPPSDPDYFYSAMTFTDTVKRQIPWVDLIQ